MTSFFVRYNLGGKTYETTSPACDGLKVDVVFDGERLTASIDAAEGVTIDKFWVDIPYAYNANKRCFVNGYQSWTDSKEYAVDGHMDTFSRLAEWGVKSVFMRRTGLGRAGETFWREYPRKKGVFYGFSYGYVREGDKYDLFASLSEREGYTIVTFDVSAGIVRIEKDLEGETFGGESKVLDAVVLSGSHDEVFDRWFDAMGVKCSTIGRKSGYTTWYNYYGGVTQAIVERDLKALAEMPQKVDIFQIDDGHQACIGEWLNTDRKKFPSGMKAAADKIHEAGMLAGLWLAPFAATRGSFIYKEHPDWLVKGKDGKPYPAGPNWGVFYPIDFYNKDAAAYIRKFFDAVLREWGYDLVKLDFLYAACVVPMHGKSRGRIMCEAMDFIRDCVGDKLIIGCGVPLMPAFGKVDFCRIGPDVALNWSYSTHKTREDVGTAKTVLCTIFRRGLDGRAFFNDPDVFLLRDNNISMPMQKRKLLAKINGLFGSLLFVSDTVSRYTDEQRAVFADTVRPKDVQVQSADLDGDILTVKYAEDGEAKTLRFDYKTGEEK